MKNKNNLNFELRFLIFVGLIILSFNSFGSIIYVKSDASGTNNGSSWTNAFNSLQSAIAASTSGDHIWVAKGTYKPTSTTNRAIYFIIPSGVKIFGAFFGTELSSYDLNLRDFILNETILSGDIGVINDSTDNSFHVIYTENVGADVEVNGFTIKDGFANGAGDRNSGGAWLNRAIGETLVSSPKIRNCKIIDNSATFAGGGLSNIATSNGNASPEITSCIFENNFCNDNTSGGQGGAIQNQTTSGGFINEIIENTFFIKNKGKIGGVINNNLYGGDVSLKMSNCVLFANSDIDGGAIMANLNFSSSTLSIWMVNCSSAENLSSDFLINNFVSFGSTGSIVSKFTNSIFWDNSTNLT
jgi:hypothetical protein